MIASIFISYRRSDAAGYANNLHYRLRQWFETDDLFYDTEHINPGDSFPKRLADGIAGAKVVLVLIGPDWLNEINHRTTLADTDFVRQEIELALRRMAGSDGLKIIPVLLGIGEPPSWRDLHESLHASIRPLFELDMHLFQGKNADWDHQFVRLRTAIANVPGIPVPRYQTPAGTVQPYRVIDQLLSPHFSDPNDTLAALRRTLETAGSAGAVSSSAIHGMGGAGKTQMALKYCREFRDRYAGVWWLRVETDDALQLDALDCCRQVGATVENGEKPAIALKRWLNQAPPDVSWLLVFDNVEGPQAVYPYLPYCGGHHVLITSRNPAWSGIAQPVAIDVWTPNHGADFLAHRLNAHRASHDHPALHDLADALGGLPLALEQAAGFLDETGMAVTEYTKQVLDYRSAPLMLDEGRAATGYEHSVLATLSIAFPRLGKDAAQLLRLLAFCAPNPVPERLFRSQPPRSLISTIKLAFRWIFRAPPFSLPKELALSARNSLQWAKTVGELRRYGLATRLLVAAWDDSTPGALDQCQQQALQLHRLTQEVVRHRMSIDPQADANVLLTLLTCTFAEKSIPAESGSRYASLVPHVLQLDQLSAHLNVDRRQLSWLLNMTGSYFLDGPALYTAAKRSLERAMALNREDLGEEHPNTLTSMSNLAIVHKEQGDLALSRTLNEQVLAVRRRVLGEEHLDTLTSMNNLASTLRSQGNLTDARALQEQLLAVHRRVLGDEHPNALTSMSNLANTLWHQGDLAGAQTIEEQVLTVRRRVLGAEHPVTLISMGNLASTLKAQGDLAAARVLEEQVLTGLRRLRGEEHPNTLTTMNNRANTLMAQGDSAEARTLLEQTLAVRRRVLGEEHPDTLMAMNNLASALSLQGDLTGARELQEKTLAGQRRVLGAEHADTLTSIGNLASMLRDQGDLAAAQTLEEQVLATQKTVLGKEHPATLNSMNNLAKTLWKQGDLTGAHTLLEQTLTVRRRVLGEEHPDTLMSMNNLADTLWHCHKHMEAIKLMTLCVGLCTKKFGAAHPNTHASRDILAQMHAAINQSTNSQANPP